MALLLKIILLLCFFSCTQSTKRFFDFNGYEFHVPKERFVPLDENILAQAIMYSCIAFIVVFLTWLRIHDTEKTLLTKYYMGKDYWCKRRILPEARSSRSLVNIQDSIVRFENRRLLGESVSCTRLTMSNSVEELEETKPGLKLCFNGSDFSKLLCKSCSSWKSTKLSTKRMDGETEIASKAKPFLLPCVRQWLNEGKPVLVPIASRPQLVPQLSNWLISHQLNTHVIGVEAPGYHAGMPVEFHLPNVSETQNKQDTPCKPITSETSGLHSELTVSDVQITKEIGQKLSGLSPVEVGSSCATELEPCCKGILVPNASPDNVPSGGARKFRYKKPLDVVPDQKDHQSQHHGVQGLSRVSRVMEEVRGGTLRQPVPMVLTSVALSFIAYKLFTKYGPA